MKFDKFHTVEEVRAPAQMSRLTFPILFLLFQQNLTVEMDEAPRRNNMVLNYLNKTLDKVFKEISRNNLSIPEVDLGEDVGRLSEVEGGVFGELTKKMDGIKSWGFKLDVNVTEVAVGGKYDLVHLDVPLLFPIFGKGRFLVSAEAISLSMELDAVYIFDREKFDIDIPKMEIVVRNSKVQFENLMNDPFLSDFLNKLISNILPDLFTMLTPPIVQLLKPTIEDIGNGILFCIKNELITGKVEECIRDLFRKTPTIAGMSLYERLIADLIEESNKL